MLDELYDASDVPIVNTESAMIVEAEKGPFQIPDMFLTRVLSQVCCYLALVTQ